MHGITPKTVPGQEQRRIECLLIDYLESHHIDLLDRCGQRAFDVVRFHEPVANDQISIWGLSELSVTDLAKYLARELGRA